MNSEPSDHASLASSPTALYHQVAQIRVSPNGLPVMEAAPPQNMSTATTTVSEASGEAVSQKRMETPLNRRQPVDKRSLDYVLRSGFAGGIAGCAAKTVVAPLDRVKILFQASNPQFAKYSGSWSGLAMAMRDINRFEGARGLYKGHSATLLRIFPYAAIKFLAYEQVRAIFIPTKDKETPFRRLISGSLAGVTSVFCTYPLEVIRVRLAFETKRTSRSSFRTICRQIYHEEASSRPVAAAASGNSSSPAMATAQTVSSSIKAVTPRTGLANFYRGFAATVVGMVPYAGVSFLIHDTIGDVLRTPNFAPYTTLPKSETPSPSKDQPGKLRVQLTASAELFSGAVSGLVAQTSSYPIEIIRRRMQVGGAMGDGKRLNMAETARKIYLERGFRGFWVGLTIGYLKVVPMAATGFFVYERMKWYLGI
ncbi:Mitochondrial carrier protein LEU5 [Talaromyces islandicus]|uniref:Mitochondrial thiamine pyrophosphate carrier 1 n=1 Tax=Talaromyces islandicus TaxID=28573 RepID=A0A0U1LL16_TALIS|nr:Mitochondrial carrier protein LEU5 [Talaromyces islandicus]